MDDLLLLIDSLMKIALLIGIMVLVATAPSRATAAPSRGLQGALFVGLVGVSAVRRDDGASIRHVFDDDDDDTFAGHSAMDHTSFIGAGGHGHDADHWRHDSDHESHRSHLAETDPFEHSFNTDATPMFGDFDSHGNTYGVTDWHSDDSWGGGMSSMFD